MCGYWGLHHLLLNGGGQDHSQECDWSGGHYHDNHHDIANLIFNDFWIIKRLERRGSVKKGGASYARGIKSMRK